MLDSSLVFKIPVYENMPDSVSPRPSIHTNGNTLLNSLSVNGVSASDFFAFTQNYVLTVDPSVTSVEIAAIPNSSASEVAGTGTVAVPEDGRDRSVLRLQPLMEIAASIRLKSINRRERRWN